MLAFSPTRTINLCYTRISALHRKGGYLVLPTVIITYHSDNILAYSPQERLLPTPQDCNFDIHNSQYHSLELVVSTFAPKLTL